MWLQHDGAPAHNDRRVRKTLNNTFPGRWIRRGSRIPFTPRSPDLTSLDFFVRGFIKEKKLSRRTHHS
ncbi:hypothetical protein WH47_08045 [Habropoda laboriosa]|uniref:Histone-lysine N-methyltransferase SETMAR n=1 Tax=Habropoda laboriosa TaxID=597456 RepID=A0A0L7QQ21_9HYME|nr:hypothetical protein WH47_08045 [Habropoda laboriosa]